MQYQDEEVEVLKTSRVFGKSIAEVRLLSTGEIIKIEQGKLQTSGHKLSSEGFALKTMAARIKNEIQGQSMLSPHESNVVPLPHQILALEKVMSGPFIRYLMADEVGMGKTIEAGLALKELKLKNLVERTLIVVPVSAMTQWAQELKNHFNERFHVYDSGHINTLTRTFSSINADNEVNIWKQHDQLIVPLDALKPMETRKGWSKEKVNTYNKYRIESVLEADFDLLIIDECHKVGGSDPTVGRFKMADLLCNAIPNVLLLSATPHRGKSDHFRRVLQLIDEDAFAGEGMPELSELEPYVVRTEKRNAVDYDGKRLFNDRSTEKHQIAYDAQKHQLQQELYEEVTNYVVHGFNLAKETKNNSYGFTMVLFQRMMSSSTQAIRDAMANRASKLEAEQEEVTKESVETNLKELGYEGQMELEFEEKVLSLVEETQAYYETELQTLQKLTELADRCIEAEIDVKADYLLNLLEELKKEEHDPDVKVIIFTEFTSTQEMLRKLLEEQGGYRCVKINGSMAYHERVKALQDFKEDVQILVSTDAAGESLNMQFAHVVINYDIPWNPMIVEQRIGRVDRIGQDKKVKAINFLIDNSIDRRVYEIVEEKLGSIMQELGIDKTSDVLDSTIQKDDIDRLYLTSLINPEDFEEESNEWLDEVKEKLKNYKSTEGAIPTVEGNELDIEKTEAIKYSPFSDWLEKLTTYYLKENNIPYSYTQNGLRFDTPQIQNEYITFDTEKGLDNPGFETLTLQHAFIQDILSTVTPVNEENNIPVIKDNETTGFWSLWELSVKNKFEETTRLVPLFIDDDQKYFPAHAQELWKTFSMQPDCFSIDHMMDQEASKKAFKTLFEAAESHLEATYREIEQELRRTTKRLRENKENAFKFQHKQISRIGIDNIRQSRQEKLKKEHQEWIQDFDISLQVIPELNCYAAVKLES